MGNALNTSGMVGFATAILVVMAILIIFAQNKLSNVTGYNTNSKLKSAYDKLLWAQVLAWISAGLAFILLLGYLLTHAEWLRTESIHLALWILVFAALIASGVLLAIALSDIDNEKLSNNNSSTSYIWGALIAGGVALLVLLISGGWRIAHKQTHETGEGDLYGVVPGGVPMQQMAPPGDVAEMPPQVQVQTNPATSF